MGKAGIIIGILLIAGALAGIIALIWNQDEHGCPDGPERDSCLMKLVNEGKAGVDACVRMNRPENTDWCYFFLAEQKSGEERIGLCSRIGTINSEYYYNRNNCLLNAALSERDRSYCELISSTQKEICIKSLS